MKINLKLLPLALLAAGIACSCSDDDKTAAVPVYSGITVSENIYTGQYGHAKVGYTSPGAYVQDAVCTYSLTAGGNKYGGGTWKIVAPRDVEPEFKFRAPMKEGNYRLSFSATFSFFADLPNGTIFGQSNSVGTNVKVMRADAVDACWGDSPERLQHVLDVNDTIQDGVRAKYWTGKLNYNNELSLKADSLPAVRTYYFSTNGELEKVVETLAFELTKKSSYKEFEDGTSGLVYDSIANMAAYPHLLGVTENYDYEKEGEPVLEGEAAEVFPVKLWEKYAKDVEQAALVNAFWGGTLTRYSQSWVYDDVTRCVVSAYCVDNNFIIEREFTPYE